MRNESLTIGRRTLHLGLAGVLLALLLPTTVAHAAGDDYQSASPVRTGLDDFIFESYDADFYLDRDSDGRSSLRTVEEFVAVFPEQQNRGMRRAIPNRYNGVPVDVRNISVTDEKGEPRAFKVEVDEGFTLVTVAADSYVSGQQTYVFSYDQSNVTQYFSNTDADEWYWDTNGVGWNQPFLSATVRVHLGDGLAEALVDEPRCYWGIEGSSDTCDIRPIADGVFEATQSPLDARHNITVAFGFTPGTFVPRESSYFSSGFGWVQPITFGGALLALGLAIQRRRGILADAAGRPTIIAEYAPPRDVSLITASLLLGKRTRAIAAQILEFAVTGKLRIVEAEAPGFFSSRTVYRLQLVDPTGVRGTELEILRALFGTSLRHGAERDLAKTDQKLGRKLYKLLEAEQTGLVAAGYRRKVPLRTYLPFALSALAVGLTIVCGVFLIKQDLGSAAPFILIALAGVSSFATMILLFRSPITRQGAEARDHLAGLKVYIQLAEADRLRMLQSPQGALRELNPVSNQTDLLKLHEKLLPYAVLFGLEKEWSEELAQHYSDQPPSWYSGSAGFNSALFASSIASVSSSVANSYSGSASSSSSGGSGGGGSSGGGGGGGGGGGV